MAQTHEVKIAKAQSSQSVPGFLLSHDSLGVGNYQGRLRIPGYYDGSNNLGRYHDQIKICRWFYTFDPIAGTVINRMADMATTVIRNRRKTKLNTDAVDDAVMAYYDALLLELRPVIKQMAMEYLLHGLVVPAYSLKRVRGDILSEKLGRKRYLVPDQMWLRNPENLELKRKPTGTARQIWLKIPKDDIELVQNKGTRSDGTEDKEAYQYLVEHFPEYVAAIRKGKNKFLLEDARAIMRKITSYSDYPTPFLVNALAALQHKAYLKTMDKAIASRAIEAMRHIKVGDKDFPADDEDINAIKALLNQSSSSDERIFNFFTNHTVVVEWIFPELEALINETKYAEPNSDIFLAMGFPRVLTTGETLRSNSSDSKIASLGPKATLEDLREALIKWVADLYKELAEKNEFKRIPDPVFAPIAAADYTALIQFGIQALNAGAISKDLVAQLYGSSWEEEANQIQTEQESGVLSPEDLRIQQQQEFQVQQTEKSQEFQMQESDKNREQQTQQNKQQQQQRNTQ
jgi:hypothetical protein